MGKNILFLFSHLNDNIYVVNKGGCVAWFAHFINCIYCVPVTGSLEFLAREQRLLIASASDNPIVHNGKAEASCCCSEAGYHQDACQPWKNSLCLCGSCFLSHHKFTAESLLQATFSAFPSPPFLASFLIFNCMVWHHVKILKWIIFF